MGESNFLIGIFQYYIYFMLFHHTEQSQIQIEDACSRWSVVYLEWESGLQTRACRRVHYSYWVHYQDLDAHVLHLYRIQSNHKYKETRSVSDQKTLEMSKVNKIAISFFKKKYFFFLRLLCFISNFSMLSQFGFPNIV